MWEKRIEILHKAVHRLETETPHDKIPSDIYGIMMQCAEWIGDVVPFPKDEWENEDSVLAIG